MIMRVRTRSRSPKNGLRWLETLLLVVGLAAVDYYIWVNAETVVYQAYQEWKFDRTLQAPAGNVPSGGAEARTPHTADEVIGRLEIPRLDIRAIVREGDGEGTLHHAVGHVPSTAFPGDIGNVGFAAHRDTFFRPLRNIRKNDRIIVSTLHGTFEYLVQTTQIVNPDDVSVLKASASKELTLVTCYPFYYIGSAPHRFIVHAIQVAATPQTPPPQIGS
jgi:sortase A